MTEVPLKKEERVKSKIRNSHITHRNLLSSKERDVNSPFTAVSPHSSEDKATQNLQLTLRKFVIAFVKEQPGDIIDYAVKHFTEIQNRRKNQLKADDDDSSLSYDLEAVQKLKEQRVNGQDSDPRGSVFSETFNSSTSVDSDDDRCIFPKTDSQRFRLMKTIRDCVIFQKLEDESMNKVIDAMYELSVQPGDRIITEDEEGDNYYVIESGTYNVYQGGTLVSTLTEGGTFGEIALLYTILRTATIDAATAGRLWVLGRETFRNVIGKHVLKQQSKYEDLISYSNLLKKMSQYELTKLLQYLEPREYKKGQKIMEFGEEIDGMYFIQEGQCSIYIFPLGETEEVFEKYLSKGNYLGDIELLFGTRINANVYAETDVQIAFLNAKYFSEFSNSIKEHMIENIKGYNFSNFLADRLNKLLNERNATLGD